MNVKIMKTAKPALTRPPIRSVTLFEFAKNAAAPSAASPAVWTASSALSESEAPVFWSCSTYSGIFSLSARAPSAICGMIAYAKKSRIALIRRNAQAVDLPRPMPRRWKIRTSGSIENARKPAATSQMIVSRTSQSPMSRAMTREDRPRTRSERGSEEAPVRPPFRDCWLRRRWRDGRRTHARLQFPVGRRIPCSWLARLRRCADVRIAG